MTRCTQTVMTQTVPRILSRQKFTMAVKSLTEKDYDYLDFRNQAYDRDYGDFLNRMDDLTARLQGKLETAYDGIWDTPHAFQYLDRKF